MLSRQPIIVEVTRGPAVESVHHVLAVVVNENGGVLHSWGNAQYFTYPRSAIKMLQALPLIESGAADRFALEEKHIALACSSHRGEKEHLAALATWMEKIKVSENILAAGPHLPYHEASAQEILRRNGKATALMNNCAGKHLGLITTCLHLGDAPQGYEKFEHPAQRRLRAVLSEVTKVDHGIAAHGTDGCGIPTYAMPLQAMATGMASFISSKESVKRKAAAERITKAIVANPFYVAGTDEFVSTVIEKTQGRSIVKTGAEGVCAGFLPEKKVAFALKCIDGAGRAVQMATMQLLLQLGGMSVAEAKAMPRFSQPTLTNWAGETVGNLRIAKPQ